MRNEASVIGTELGRRSAIKHHMDARSLRATPLYTLCITHIIHTRFIGSPLRLHCQLGLELAEPGVLGLKRVLMLSWQGAQRTSWSPAPVVGSVVGSVDESRTRALQGDIHIRCLRDVDATLPAERGT